MDTRIRQRIQQLQREINSSNSRGCENFSLKGKNLFKHRLVKNRHWILVISKILKVKPCWRWKVKVKPWLLPAPVEGEALAVTWALKDTKFFTLGCNDLIVTTDHKSLVKRFGDGSLDEITNTRIFCLKQCTLAQGFPYWGGWGVGESPPTSQKFAYPPHLEKSLPPTK